jgi:sugar transferase (PEP-CTERM system associated)
MVRLFQVYYPVRTIVLVVGEALIVALSFFLAAWIRLGSDTYASLSYDLGLMKILAVTGFALLTSYYFDLYAPQRLTSPAEAYFRTLLVLGLLSFTLAGLAYVAPTFSLGPDVFLIGLIILTVTMLSWRSFYTWLLESPFLREKVYVVGWGEAAQRFVDVIASRRDLGMDVVAWAGGAAEPPTREQFSEQIMTLARENRFDRVIVAMPDRRGAMPVRELLDLRVQGIRVEEAGTLLEKITGRIALEGLHPSALIFAEGFRISDTLLVLRRIVSIAVSFAVLLCCLPLLPFIILGIKLTSSGPVLFRQSRVGRRGENFDLYKFRTMRVDAEAKTGPTWAGASDPRITSFGRILRSLRLDEIPQLWNVLKGDMGFVGPRPERPEFVQWLAEAIPYYNLRHMIRPGLTGWAQVKYQYGASLDQTKEKLQYDLYYIKNMSLALDLLIVFETIKTVLLGRGSR